jgi:cytochrome P450
MSASHDVSGARIDEELRRFSAHTTSPRRSLELFDAARGTCPVAHSDEHEGFHLLLGYAEVKQGAADHEGLSSASQVARPVLPREPLAALEMDEPRHRHWRELFAQAVTPHTVSVMEPLVRADVNRHIDRFIECGSADLVKELAEPVPAEAICRLVGIDDDLVAEVRTRAARMFSVLNDPELFGQRVREFAEITVAEAHRRIAHPRDDYLTYLANVEVEGEPLGDEGIVAVLIGFLGAGHHTTTAALTSLVHEVFGDESVRARVADDPAKLVPIAVEEALRLWPPFFGFFRRATGDTQLAGVDIPAGGDVYLGWASANRDPAVFDDPNRFRLDRGRNRHLSFGFGVHACPGAPLARMEMRVVLEELIRRIPDLTVEAAEPEYVFSGGDYAHIRTLPVRFSPGVPEGDVRR